MHACQLPAGADDALLTAPPRRQEPRARGRYRRLSSIGNRAWRSGAAHGDRLDAGDILAGLVNVPLPGRMAEPALAHRLAASSRHRTALSIFGPPNGHVRLPRRDQHRLSPLAVAQLSRRIEPCFEHFRGARPRAGMGRHGQAEQAAGRRSGKVTVERGIHTPKIGGACGAARPGRQSRRGGERSRRHRPAAHRWRYGVLGRRCHHRREAPHDGMSGIGDRRAPAHIDRPP